MPKRKQRAWTTEISICILFPCITQLHLVPRSRCCQLRWDHSQSDKRVPLCLSSGFCACPVIVKPIMYREEVPNGVFDADLSPQLNGLAVSALQVINTKYKETHFGALSKKSANIWQPQLRDTDKLWQFSRTSDYKYRCFSVFRYKMQDSCQNWGWTHFVKSLIASFETSFVCILKPTFRSWLLW